MTFYNPSYTKTFLSVLGLLVLQAGCIVPKVTEGFASLDLKDIKTISRRELNPDESPWVGFSRVEYIDGTAEPKTWDYVYRKTFNRSKDDAAVAIATVEVPHQESALLLIRQYRPAQNKIVVEFPAGLIDSHIGESEADAALRELREETGYGDHIPGVKVNVRSVHRRLAVDSGISSSCVTIVQASIKLDHENIEALPNFQDGEKIITDVVPLSKLGDYIEYYQNDKDHIVSAEILHFAAGLALSKNK